MSVTNETNIRYLTRDNMNCTADRILRVISLNAIYGWCREYLESVECGHYSPDSQEKSGNYEAGRLITGYFSGLGKAIGRVCVYACARVSGQ